MRIVIANDDPLNDSSSVSIVAGNLATEYRKRGHEVHVLTSHRAADHPEIIREPEVTSLPTSLRTSLRHFGAVWQPRLTGEIRAELQRLKPDAVHAHNLHRWLGYGLLDAARRLTPHVVLTTHDVFSFAFARLATPRYLDHLDARLSPVDHLKAVGLEYNPLRNTAIRRILARSAQVVSPSCALAEALRKNGIDTTAVVANGIDASTWMPDPTARARFETVGRPTILFAGRLSADKGSTPLLAALRRLRAEFPSVLLLVVGEERRWEKLVAEAGARDVIGNVRCLGWLPHAEIRAAYAACDVVAVPSLCLDVFPSVNLEAMAAGKPVVGTCFGGTPEIVQDGMTGFVLDPRDDIKLADALAKLLRNPDLATRMGTAGRLRVEKDFSLSHQATRYLAILSRGSSTAAAS